MSRPIASLSLDLDNKWSYLKIHGEESWKEFPSYLPLVVPRILEILDQEKLKITFFVVGQDAAQPENQPVLKQIADAGHEIGNHSFHHESWLHLHSEQEIKQELVQAHELIERVTGKSPRGFRGPGYSLSESVLRVLTEMGYQYDCSTWPTIIGPLARAYYMRTGEFTAEEKAERSQLFGKFSEGLRPLKPYRWSGLPKPLVEIPVSTLPLFRVPVHYSYLLYLRCVSELAAKLYYQSSLKLFRLTRTTPSLLLHSLDFLGGDDEKDLNFFPAMGMRSADKSGFMRGLLRSLRNKFEVVTMSEHATRVSAGRLAEIKPHFPPQTASPVKDRLKDDGLSADV